MANQAYVNDLKKYFRKNVLFLQKALSLYS